ncbi:hypothetical protein Cpir12675_002738 [Ceratocystis pirilliformis]|uniref:Uncharacterized protein n=1 Tax=Ceratocystis pirilliformis TaxID=259994 RepID=A0ABR3Z8W5_9PEZI
MKLTILPLFSTLIGLTTALWLPSLTPPHPSLISDPSTPKHWTILRLQRVCANDLSQCTYSLLTLPDNSASPTSCNVTVTSPETATQPATQLSITRSPCTRYSADSGLELQKPNEIVAGPDFAVSLSVRSGLVGLAIVSGSGAATRGAVYDFDEGLFHEEGGFAGPQTAEVRSLEDLQQRGWCEDVPEQQVQARAIEAEALRGIEELESAAAWSVANATRYYNSDFSTVILQFRLFAEDYESINCVVVSAVPATADWKRYSFYSHNCLPEVPWHVSWGYNERRDSGVMTVMNPDRTRVAWFGWDNVNGNKQLDDVGPNDTQKVTPTSV